VSAAHPQDAEIRALYAQYLAGWNQRSGASVSACFTDDGEVVGFDGTVHFGRLSIAADLRRLFADHPTPAYIGLVRSVRPVAAGVAVLHAVAGMVPVGGDDLDPGLHAVHTLVAVEDDGRWKIAVFQATPAQYHGRPEAVEALTAELQAAR
jgi:uncharacterized protein (TIGR02246 family)